MLLQLSFTGIGLVSGIQCLAHVANIIIADLVMRPETQHLPDIHKFKACFVQCNVVKWWDLHQLPDFSKKEFDTVPGIRSANAGIYEPTWSNFWDDSEDDRRHYCAAVSINAEHPMELTCLAIQSLLSEDKRGVVLYASSLGGS
ncbi:hypothetical protein Vi05172_g1751 [Venturia inaequalis]|nr:hypothetical protein Vi05172_g1751 [Venturia inaequalis]